MRRLIVLVAGLVIWLGPAAAAYADGGICKAGGGTQHDCHIYINGVSTHCGTYTEVGGAISCFK